MLCFFLSFCSPFSSARFLLFLLSPSFSLSLSLPLRPLSVLSPPSSSLSPFSSFCYSCALSSFCLHMYFLLSSHALLPERLLAITHNAACHPLTTSASCSLQGYNDPKGKSSTKPKIVEPLAGIKVLASAASAYRGGGGEGESGVVDELEMNLRK